ncbi:MAG: hypothetical protein ABJP44_18215 [Sulfitobacter sp.]|uniref:hypothetical protein n=1 Tax=Sulfitobacter sp. TaxID=1903071 RepID=UPI003299355B
MSGEVSWDEVLAGVVTEILDRERTSLHQEFERQQDLPNLEDNQLPLGAEVLATQLHDPQL